MNLREGAYQDFATSLQRALHWNWEWVCSTWGSFSGENCVSESCTAAGCDGSEQKPLSPGAHASGWGLGSSLLALPWLLSSAALGYWHACFLFMEMGAWQPPTEMGGGSKMEGGMVAILWVRSWALLSVDNACTSALSAVDPGRCLCLLLLTPVLIPNQ